MRAVWTWLDAQDPATLLALTLLAGITLGALEWARADKVRRRDSRRALRQRWTRS